jgi:AraC family transcriptional regulator, arabinose operon regulatory protein
MPQRPVREQNLPPFIAGHFRSDRHYTTERDHGRDDHLLILTLGGAGVFDRGRPSERVVRRGELTYLPPRAPHHYATHQRHWELLWCHFPTDARWHDLLEWAGSPGTLRVFTLGTAFARVRRQFQTLLQASRRSDGMALRRTANALELLLIECRGVVIQEPGRLDPRIRRTLDHIADHLGTAHTLRSLADVAGLSVGRLGHLFKETVGLSPMAFLQAQRIHRAQQLLEVTSLTVKEVSLQLGFESPFYFSKKFRRQTGRSPRQFRNQPRAKP